jgi:hypothetical protein
LYAEKPCATAEDLWKGEEPEICVSPYASAGEASDVWEGEEPEGCASSYASAGEGSDVPEQQQDENSLCIEAALDFPPGLSEEEKRRMIEGYMEEEERILASIRDEEEEEPFSIEAALNIPPNASEEERRRMVEGYLKLQERIMASIGKAPDPPGATASDMALAGSVQDEEDQEAWAIEAVAVAVAEPVSPPPPQETSTRRTHHSGSRSNSRNNSRSNNRSGNSHVDNPNHILSVTRVGSSYVLEC